MSLGSDCVITDVRVRSYETEVVFTTRKTLTFFFLFFSFVPNNITSFVTSFLQMFCYEVWN